MTSIYRPPVKPRMFSKVIDRAAPVGFLAGTEHGNDWNFSSPSSEAPQFPNRQNVTF